MKLCKSCNEIKSLDSFSKDKSRADGHHYHCKVCSKAKDKLRYENNKDVRCEQSKAYYEANQEEIKQKQNERYNKNKQYYKEWAQNNKSKVKKNLNNWRSKNRSNINSYLRNRRKNDPQYAMIENLRGRVRSILLQNKINKKESIIGWLGCDLGFFKTWIESKFESWMTWENRGRFNGEVNFGWDLDHIVPLSSAKNIQEIKALCHYTNIQPLCGYINRCIKRDNL